MALRQYDPTQIVLIWNGIDLSAGAAAGTFIEVSRDNPSSSLATGMGTLNTRLKNPSRSGRVTVTLKHVSEANDLLSAAVLADETEGVDDVIAGMLIQDFEGQTKHVCEQAYLEGYPEESYSSDDEPTREWTIICPILSMGSNGSNDL